MIESAQLCIVLLAVVAAVVLAARWLGVPGPILLVPAGLILALIPGLPHLRLDPAFALMLFLPPLIYAAAVNTSWPDFYSNLRPISLLAVGCVLFTTIAVAVTAHYLLGFTWALGCVLGASVRVTTGRCRRNRHRRSAQRAPAHRHHPRRGRHGERCHRADRLPIRHGRGHLRIVFTLERRAHFLGSGGLRSDLGIGGWIRFIIDPEIGRTIRAWRSPSRC